MKTKVIIILLFLGGFIEYLLAQSSHTIYQDCSKNGSKIDLRTQGIENKHKWVGLGLSVKWATCNVGASKEEDYGSYYPFSYLKPTTIAYQHYGFTSCCTNAVLKPSYDVATVDWGNNWRIPTPTEIKELLNNCSATWAQKNGIQGYVLKSKKNNSEIFLPAGGERYRTYDGYVCNDYKGTRGYYWSNTLDMQSSSSAYCLYFSSTSLGCNSRERYISLAVRPVCTNASSTGGYIITINTKNCTEQNIISCDSGYTMEIKAEAKTNYHFVRWSDGNTTNPRTITVNSNMTFTAEFASNTYTISTSATNGTVSGAGTYNYNTSVTLKATAKAGYHFVRWDDNNTSVSRTITVSADVTYTAYFEADTVSTTEKVLPGLFSVNDSMKVRFSSGNLQYRATPGTHQCADGTAQKGIWRFAAHQYDFIGTLNSNISSTYASWIDLFGWGTSGWSNGATCYQPWSTSQTNTDYLTPGLVGTPSYADWGVYNAIANGGNKTNLWRTLTGAEMDYILNVRENADSLRTSACINNTYGLLLLPDDFVKPDGITINLSVIACTENTYSTSQFDALENSGAVFIPYAGYREGTIISHDSGDYMGDYWMADSYSDKKAHRLIIRNARATAGESNEQKMYGFSVRLVKPLYHIHVLPNDNVKGSTIGSGEYDNKSTITISATPNDCYQFLKWSDGNTDNPRSITVTQDSTFSAIFEKIQFNLSVDVNDPEHSEVTTSAVED